MCVCMEAYLYVCVYVYRHNEEIFCRLVAMISDAGMCICIYMDGCMCVYMEAYVCIYIYMYMYIMKRPSVD
jgi:hypothetical protein